MPSSSINDSSDNKEVSHNDDNNNNSSSYNIGNFVSDDIDISSQCSNRNDNVSFDNFSLCHREVSFENYSEKFKRFLTSESRKKGDGLSD